jgi:hypothetical protein
MALRWHFAPALAMFTITQVAGDAIENAEASGIVDAA